MVRLNEVRQNGVAVDAPDSFDAGLTFIGVIRTPWTSRLTVRAKGEPTGRSAASKSPSPGSRR
jgi:tRNA (adenine37-N6)-methyltransferase